MILVNPSISRAPLHIIGHYTDLEWSWPLFLSISKPPMHSIIKMSPGRVGDTPKCCPRPPGRGQHFGVEPTLPWRHFLCRLSVTIWSLFRKIHSHRYESALWMHCTLATKPTQQTDHTWTKHSLQMWTIQTWPRVINLSAVVHGRRHKPLISSGDHKINTRLVMHACEVEWLLI